MNEMSKKNTKLSDRIVLAALKYVAYDGWTEKSLDSAVKDAGLEPGIENVIFRGGAHDAVKHLSEYLDRKMLEKLKDVDLAGMRIRDRIATCVMTRLILTASYKEGARRTVAYLMLPANVPLGTKLLSQTVSEMWYAAGDKSTDYNFYTKRGLLAIVYSSTTLHWLKDTSDDFVETRIFLNRRIDEIMKITQCGKKAKDSLDFLLAPLKIFRGQFFF